LAKSGVCGSNNYKGINKLRRDHTWKRGDATA